jgi:hypothetical protein
VDGLQTFGVGLRLLTVGQLAGGEYSFALVAFPDGGTVF